MARPITTKSRVTLLAEALESTNKTIESLKSIDLRTTRGSLRDSIRKARDESQALQDELQQALREDGAELRRTG